MLALLDTYPIHADRKKLSPNQAEELHLREEKFYDWFKPYLREKTDSTDLADTEFEKMWAVMRHNLSLIKSYIPPKLNGDLTIFKAMQATQPLNQDAWSSIVMGKINTYEINCNHGQMASPDSMAQIGKAISTELR